MTVSNRPSPAPAAVAEGAEGSLTRLSVQGEFTIHRAAELHPAFMSAIARGGDIQVDLSQVTEIDSAGVQLLAMLKRAAQAEQCDLLLVGHSSAVLDVFELLSLSSFFGDPLFIESLGEP